MIARPSARSTVNDSSVTVTLRARGSSLFSDQRTHTIPPRILPMLLAALGGILPRAWSHLQPNLKGITPVCLSRGSNPNIAWIPAKSMRE
jgi:hypothetical protein